MKKGRKNVKFGQLSPVERKNLSPRKAYYLKLTHGCMGLFPAIFSDDPQDVIVCLDRNLLITKIWPMLTRRQSELVEIVVLFDPERGVAFSASAIDDFGNRAQSMAIISQEVFDRLTADVVKPFKWAPGLVGDDMTEAEFQETLATALRKCQKN